MNSEIALMSLASAICMGGAASLLLHRETLVRSSSGGIRWYELLIALAGAVLALGTLSASGMKRSIDGWGICILAGSCLIILISICLPLYVPAPRRGTRTLIVGAAKASGFVLAFWCFAVLGGMDSALVLLGCVLPILLVLVNLVRLLVALIRRTSVYVSLASLFAYGALASAGAIGSIVVTLPGPLVKSAEDSLGQHLPPAEGWSEEHLDRAFQHADELGSFAVIVIQDGRLVAEWGDTDKRTNAHSLRKSILSALFGIAEQKGLINLNSTLEELDIDDRNRPLTAEERRAKVWHLLTSTSGIYHSYIGDEEGNRPKPGSHEPGTFFYYNNWSFNALGTIFERQTGLTIGSALKQWIAMPIGMRDFREKDVIYTRFPKPFASRHRAYSIDISARDLALFGLLFLRNGKWEGQQIIPAEWIRRSTEAYISTGRVGYGYSWWRSLGDPAWLSDQMYYGTGTGGQKLLIDPRRNLVAVHRTDTRAGAPRGLWIRFGQRVNNKQFLELIRRILEADPEHNRPEHER